MTSTTFARFEDKIKKLYGRSARIEWNTDIGLHVIGPRCWIIVNDTTSEVLAEGKTLEKAIGNFTRKLIQKPHR